MRLLRPRVIAQLQKTVADLQAYSREHRRSVRKQVQEETSAGQRAVRDALARLEQELQGLRAQQKEQAAATEQALAQRPEGWHNRGLPILRAISGA